MMRRYDDDEDEDIDNTSARLERPRGSAAARAGSAAMTLIAALLSFVEFFQICLLMLI